MIICAPRIHPAGYGALRSDLAQNSAFRFLRFDSPDEIAQRIRKAIGPKTRAFGVTWLHSSSGVRLPIARIAETLVDVNRGREEKDRVLLIVDGVHGIGVEDPKITALGCDAFVAGTHKWLFGPRAPVRLGQAGSLVACLR